jgi:hypothetical protein
MRNAFLDMMANDDWQHHFSVNHCSITEVTMSYLLGVDSRDLWEDLDTLDLNVVTQSVPDQSPVMALSLLSAESPF